MNGTSANERAAATELEALKEKAEFSRTGERYVVGPFGKQYPVRRFAGISSYGFKDPNKHLSQPELLLKNPEPGMHYGWPKADDDGTRAKLRDGHYIKVKPDELDQHTGLAISTHKGTNAGTEVRWYSHVLVKIPHEAWIELYEEPAMYSMTRLDMEAEAFQEKVKVVSKGVAVPSVEIGVDQGQN